MNRILPGLTWLILWILSWLPGFILQFLSFLISVLLFSILRYRREVVSANLKRSLPEFTPLEQNDIAKKFYRHFSELFIEMILLVRLKPGKDAGRIRLTDPEILSRAYDQKQNIILLSGHFGNWEWNLLPTLASGYRLLGVYKPQSSAFADQLMKSIRQKPGIRLIPMKNTLREITRELNENNGPFALLLIADQIPARGDIRFWTSFLHQETAFFTGGEKLAKRYGLPVFYVDQVKQGFGKYLTRVSPVYDGSSPSEEGGITRAFAAKLEESIHETPHLWLWSHRRWKYHREELPLRP